MPPDPPALAQHRGEAPPLNPSPVREVMVDHQGCLGRCPVYAVTLRDDGTWEWEGKDFASPTGLLKGKTYESVFSPLFRWLAEHPELYAASTDRIHCNDCEVVEFRFRLKTGESVVVRYGMGLTGDDFWALSNLVDAVIGREKSRRNSESHARSPAA